MALFQATALATNDKSLARNGKALPTIDAYLLAVSSVQRGHGNLVPFRVPLLILLREKEQPAIRMVAFGGRERRATMPTHPDRDFSAGRASKKLDFGDWRSEYAPTLEELFEDPDIRKRIGRLIAEQVHPII